MQHCCRSVKMDEGKKPTTYFDGLHEGESDELRALRLALVKERDELRADAERFRWMRANLTRLVVATQGGDAPRKVESLWVNENMPAPCEASVDAAVDAAMTAAPAVGAA
jgi:hypothetical protein